MPVAREGREGKEVKVSLTCAVPHCSVPAECKETKQHGEGREGRGGEKKEAFFYVTSPTFRLTGTATGEDESSSQRKGGKKIKGKRRKKGRDRPNSVFIRGLVVFAEGL